MGNFGRKQTYLQENRRNLDPQPNIFKYQYQGSQGTGA